MKSNPNKNQFLSKRELDVLQLSAKELCCREISEQLFISIRTVENHRNNILKKCQAKSLTGALLYILKHNYLRLEDF